MQLYERKNARLKFVKSQSGMGMTILLWVWAIKTYCITGGLWYSIPFSILWVLKVSATWQSSYEKEPTTTSFILVGYRLCVCASGSLITVILNFLTLIIVLCLHFGQKRGKFLSSVSSLTTVRVLL